jgi:hypothetical protein
MKKSQRTIAKRVLVGALLTASLSCGAGSAFAAYGIDFPVVPTTFQENGGTVTTAADPYSVIGWSFRANRDLYLNRLGVYDSDIERRHSEVHHVGIWNAADTTVPLASVTINESTGFTPESLSGAYFHFENLAAPLLLKAGQTYHVGATLYGGSTAGFDMFASLNAGDLPVLVNSNITYLNGVNGITNSVGQLVFPGTIDTFATYTVGANIDVTPTPIPAAAWLLGSGLLGLIGIRRKNNQ